MEIPSEFELMGCAPYNPFAREGKYISAVYNVMISVMYGVFCCIIYNKVDQTQRNKIKQMILK